MKVKQNLLLTVACSVGVILASVDISNAQISGELWQNQPTASGNALLGYGDPTSLSYLGTPDATFTSTGVNYNPTDTGAIYTPSTFLNNPTFNNKSANFSTPALGYGPNASLDHTYFYFTGNLFLNAGPNSFVVGHDDGLQLHIDGIPGLVVDKPGPTGLDETPFSVNAPATGTYHFELSYGETFGPPASLVWEINQQTVGVPTDDGSVPDVSSTLPLLGIGLSGLAALARKIKK